MKNKRSKEEYESAVAKSLSIAGVCRELGIKPIGGNYKCVRHAIEEYDIDTTHFTGQGWNIGLKFQPHPAKPLEEILTEDSYYPSYKLKIRLFKTGLKEQKCENCNNAEWQGQSIPLELHHINGNNRDNRLENIQILCPNCHALTDTYRGKNLHKKEEKIVKPKTICKKQKITTSVQPVKDYGNCKQCGKPLTKNQTKFCSYKCMREYNSVHIPKKNIIEAIIKHHGNITKAAQEFNISDNGFRKQLKKENLPYHSNELKQMIDNGTLK